jgi:uncharacterized beta-barrel protein YwiB (DUF1934 family)
LKNTEECANIKIVSKRTQAGVTDKSEYFAEGSFYKKNGAYYVTYKEDLTTGLQNTRTFLKISQNGVIMRKMGDFKTAVSYEEGRETDLVYETPFGKMNMKIKTSKITDKLSQNGGTLKIVYTLCAGGEDIENETILDVKLRSEKNEI